MQGIKNLMSLMRNPANLRSAVAPKAAASQKQAASGDQLGGFLHQLKSGGIKSNLNQPALPHTASGRVNLVG